jgi:hypothetical protein
MVAAFCLVALTPTASKEAVAQGIRVTGITYPYYGYSGGYNSGYGTGYGGYGYNGNVYGGYGHNGNVYRGYGYSGYGNGPYGYGSSGAYGYPSYGGYGYGNSTTYTLYYRGARLQGGTYRPIYNPNDTRFYSPYGSW